MGVLYSKKVHKKKEKKKEEECKKTKQNLFSLHMQPVSSSVVGQSWASQPSPGHSMRLQVLTALPLPSGGISGGWRELLLLHRPQRCKSPALMPVHSIDREPTQEQSMANRDCQGLLALGLLHPAAHHQWCQGNMEHIKHDFVTPEVVAKSSGPFSSVLSVRGKAWGSVAGCCRLTMDCPTGINSKDSASRPWDTFWGSKTLWKK